MGIYEHTGGKRIVLVGHSKGATDSVAAVGKYKDRMIGKVVGIVSLCGVMGGTPLAGGLFNVKLYRGIAIRVIRHFLGGEKHAVSDLRHDLRKKWMDEFPYPDEIPIITFSSDCTSYTSALGVLSSLFHKNYVGIKNDGVVLSCDSDLPGSTRVFFNGDWSHDMSAYDNPKASEKASLVNEAAITLLLKRIPE